MHLIGWESGARFLGQSQGRLLSKTSGIPGHGKKKFTDILFKLLLVSFMSCLLFCSEEAEEYKRKLIQVRERQVRGQAVSHYSRGFSSLKRRCNLVFFFFVEIIAAVFDFYLSGRLGKEICVRGVSDSQKEGEG